MNPNTNERPVALVTGAGTGIGRACTLALAAAGHDVVVVYSRSKDAAEATLEEARGLGSDGFTWAADVSDDEAVRSLMGEVAGRFGRLDVLVNNAGTSIETPPEDLDLVDLADWDRVFAVNVRGLFQVSRAAAPMLRESRGSIVNMASIVADRPTAQPLPYAASKAAIVNLTKTLARVLAPEVRVNAVAPGWLEGDWMQRNLADNYDRLMERRAKQTPLRRVATADDVAETVVTLATSHRMVTGQVVVVDGGYSTSS